MAMTAREAAWTALQRWRKNGAWSDAALHAVLQNAQLEPRDAALAARICYGTLQNLTLLDHYLSVYCTTPLQKLEPKVLDLLAQVANADGLVIATPVYKASFSGALKTVLDLLPERALAHKVVLPMATGGSIAHMLAVDYALKPVLSALKAQELLHGIFAEDSVKIIHLDGTGTAGEVHDRIYEEVMGACQN